MMSLKLWHLRPKDALGQRSIRHLVSDIRGINAFLAMQCDKGKRARDAGLQKVLQDVTNRSVGHVT